MVSYQRDIWTEIAKKLTLEERHNVACSCRSLYTVLVDLPWKEECLRILDLREADSPPVKLKWFQIRRLISAPLLRNMYSYMEFDRTLAMFRLGGIILGPRALISNSSAPPRQLPPENVMEAEGLLTTGSFMIEDVHRGIWVTDVHLLKCAKCNPSVHCSGRVLTLVAWAVQLFGMKAFQRGKLEFENITSVVRKGDMTEACIFDVDHVDTEISGFVTHPTPFGREPGWVPPQTMRTQHAVAMRADVEDGYAVHYEVMRSRWGRAVAIRISTTLKGAMHA